MIIWRPSMDGSASTLAMPPGLGFHPFEQAESQFLMRHLRRPRKRKVTFTLSPSSKNRRNGFSF